MIVCPDCKAENIAGSDTCESCGQDLRNLALPTPTSEFEEHLMNDPLSILNGRDVHTVAPGDPVALAVHAMRNDESECVLVKEGDEIVGILSERDILMKAAGENVDLNALAVRDIMTPDPVMLREDDTLAVALHKMSIGGFRHIPFVSGEGATRLISIQDVFAHVSQFIDEQEENLSHA